MSRETDHNETDNKQPGGNPSGPPSEGSTPRRTNNNSDKKKGETGNSTTGFRGDTEKMKGFVFELPTCDSQMTDTIDMLKRYARLTYTSAPSMGSLFLRVPKQPEIKKPGAKPIPTGEPEKRGGPPTITVFDTELFKVEVSNYGKEVRGLERDLIAFFSVIFGQCSPSLRAELRSQDGFDEAELKGDCLWILAAIRGALTKFDKGNYVHEAIHDLWSRFYRDYQGPRSTVDYFNAFEALVKTLQENDAIGSPPLTQDPDPDVIGRDDDETRRNLRERALAVALIKNSDNHRFAKLKDDLRTNYARGTDQWPKTLTGAYNMLVTHERHESNRPRPGRRGGGGGGGGTRGKNKTGNGTGTGGPKGHQFAMASSPPFPPGSILLDSESSESIFRDLSLLSNVRVGESPMTLYTNGGTRRATQQGEYRGLGNPLTVWVDTTSLANILALRDVRKLARVTLDTAKELALVVHLPNGDLMRFVEHDDTGLYVYHPEYNEVKVPVKAYTMLQTVSKNRTLFSRRELDGADAARALYRQVGRPSQSRFVEYLSKNLIRNCPVTIADAKRAAYIYGADPAFLKGKRTQKKALPHIPTTIPTPVPDFITEHHNNVTLCIDFFYVQGSIFFHAISRKLGFRTCLPVNNRSKTTILRALRKVLRLYAQRGFDIQDVHADQEFECVRSDLAGLHLDKDFVFLKHGIALETCTTNAHVGEAERSIRTIKETVRATIHGMPYRRLPRQMIHGLVAYATQTLNAFPYPEGVSPHLSPNTIITGTPTPDYNDYQLEFGAYVLLTDRTTNTPRARTFGAIALYPTGNQDRSYYFLSLVSGEVISKAPGYWTELPVTDPAIARVEHMAKDQGQPLIQESNFLTEFSPDLIVEDDEYDKDYVYEPDADEDLAYDTDDDEPEADDGGAPPGAHDPKATGADPPAIDDITDDGTVEDEGAEEPAVNQSGDDVDDDADDDVSDAADDGVGDDVDDDVEASLGDMATEEAVEDTDGENTHGESNTSDGDDIDDDPNVHQDRYNLRSNRGRSYEHRFVSDMDNPINRQSYGNDGYGMFQSTLRPPTQTERILHGWVMTQMSAKAGIRRYGDAAREAMRQEFRQLDEKGVFDPVHATKLAPEVRKQALRCINVIKKKRCGKIKGRTCADGRPQRGLYDKMDTSSPTASSDAILLTVIVDALERRDVATADVAGAYLNANMDDYVLMRLTGEDVTLMCEANTTYEEFVSTEGGTRVLYLRLAKALYGCVKSAMLWYRLFTSTLKDLGFVLNPYDPCVANATINAKQCTIVWYVDDNKVSHCDPEVVSDIISKIEGFFGKMTVTRGDTHDFLGMNIVFNKERGTAKITMSSYLHEAIRESGLDIRRVAATPATGKLFELDETAAALPKKEADSFRRIVCKLLYVGLRARADILTTLSFLTTRITCPSTQDQKKLRRLLEYLFGTLDLSLILGADNLGTVYTWVDASYAVHRDMRSHTGGVISFGTGGILCKSSKQKLNTKSSTEAELIGASDYLPNTIWVMAFMAAQGYPILDSRFAQDNESAIRLERNGRASAGQKSRHINIRHFWITDRLRTDDIHLEHCPTEAMLADFLTKPLQGNLFRKFRAVLLGHAHIGSLLPVSVSSPPEERVEDSVRTDKRKSIRWSDVVKRTRI